MQHHQGPYHHRHHHFHHCGHWQGEEPGEQLCKTKPLSSSCKNFLIAEPEILSISDDHMIHRFADQMVQWWCLMPFEGRRYECEFVPHRLLPPVTSVYLNKYMVPLCFMFSKSTWTDWMYNVHKHA